VLNVAVKAFVNTEYTDNIAKNAREAVFALMVKKSVFVLNVEEMGCAHTEKENECVMNAKGVVFVFMINKLVIVLNVKEVVFAFIIKEKVYAKNVVVANCANRLGAIRHPLKNTMVIVCTVVSTFSPICVFQETIKPKKRTWLTVSKKHFKISTGSVIGR
jgi:hypothetical protein